MPPSLDAWPPWSLPVALGVLGLLLGSFLNVVIARVPQGQSIVRPGSRCPGCGHVLAWFENVPVLSWLFLRGRCSACRAKISPRYLLVEVLTAGLYLAVWAQVEPGWPLVRGLVLVTLLLPLTFIDLEHWILPFSLTLPGIALGVALAAPLGAQALVASLLGGGLAFLFFWALEWLGEKIFQKEALGGGDKYLLALIGAFLGPLALLPVVFFASLQGSLVGLLLLATRGRAGPAAPPDGPADDWVPGPTNLPFGPWLSLGALELLLFGPWLAERLSGTPLELLVPVR
jgi:leader peptidase (prepilin peptidase)/N-methyltransferase